MYTHVSQVHHDKKDNAYVGCTNRREGVIKHRQLVTKQSPEVSLVIQL
uniref:Uncharacterized protein n=1 Tax=Arundo donax TaxID=35708 RepID=A0A0A9D7Y4_ARUDO